MDTPEDQAAADDAPGADRVTEGPLERELPDEVIEAIRMADAFQASLEELIASYAPSEQRAVRKALYIDGDGRPATRYNRLRSVPAPGTAPAPPPPPDTDRAAGDPDAISGSPFRRRRPPPPS